MENKTFYQERLSSASADQQIKLKSKLSASYLNRRRKNKNGDDVIIHPQQSGAGQLHEENNHILMMVALWLMDPLYSTAWIQAAWVVGFLGPIRHQPGASYPLSFCRLFIWHHTGTPWGEAAGVNRDRRQGKMMGNTESQLGQASNKKYAIWIQIL